MRGFAGARRRVQAHRTHRIVGRLHDLQLVAAELQRGAGLRDGLQPLHDQAVEVFGPSIGRRQPIIRFSSRTLAAPLTMKLPSASGWTSR
jgi:hypothetical protein